MNKIIDKLGMAVFTAAILIAGAVSTFGQGPWAIAPVSKPDTTAGVAAADLPRWGGETSERSIKVDSAINLSLCVTQGTVKINGWNRNEVRVFVQDGSKFGFGVQLKNPKTGDPALMKILGIDTKNKHAAPIECIWGGEIEIDVPVRAIINLKGQEITTSIDSVRKASVKSVGGNISIRNVTEGVNAYAGQGGITVEGSAGQMALESTTGNIVVFDVAPAEVGDLFKAKTHGGTISLQQLAYRQIEVGSISGSVLYNGNILSGSSYNFNTSKGSIRMVIPKDSACQISATYGFGSFSSDLPFKVLTENIYEGPIKNMVVTVGGGGDASLRLTTNNGSISIKKQ